MAAFALAAACTARPADNGAAGSEVTVTPAPCVHTTTASIMERGTDALPVGACVVDPNEPVCELVLRDPCPCINVLVPREFHSCSCIDGQWRCELTAIDMGLCPLDLPAPECTRDGLGGAGGTGPGAGGAGGSASQ